MILTNHRIFLTGLKIHFVKVVVIGLHEAVLIQNYC